MSDSRFRTIIEPFTIKSVEPIQMTTMKQREAILKESNYNLFKIKAQDVIIDLLTDSGTGAMSSNQWAQIMNGDESYAGSKSFQLFEKTVQEIFGYKHVIPTHQGRAAERILFSVMCKPGDVVPNNAHFDTTRANTEATGATAVDCPSKESLETQVVSPFKGNMNLEMLEAVIEKHGPENIPLCMMTVTNNMNGGQPVSMANIRAVRKITQKAGIPLYFDACRFAENAYFIKTRELEFADSSISEIVTEMMSYGDGCTMSAKKDGMANIGGFLCTNEDVLARKQKDLLILSEGFPTYGGLAGRDLGAIAAGLVEVLDEHYLAYRIAEARYLGSRLLEVGVPIIDPPGGHAIYIDAKKMLPHIDPLKYPGQSLAVAFYKHGGVRSCEIGTVMANRRDENNVELPHDVELLRLALPRRTHTQSHIDYVIEVAKEVYEKRSEIKGFRISRQPKVLRHFSCDFELIT